MECRAGFLSQLLNTLMLKLIKLIKKTRNWVKIVLKMYTQPTTSLSRAVFLKTTFTLTVFFAIHFRFVLLNVIAPEPRVWITKETALSRFVTSVVKTSLSSKRWNLNSWMVSAFFLLVKQRICSSYVFCYTQFGIKIESQTRLLSQLKALWCIVMHT